MKRHSDIVISASERVRAFSQEELVKQAAALCPGAYREFIDNLTVALVTYYIAKEQESNE